MAGFMRNDRSVGWMFTWDHTVERRALVAEPLLPGAESTEVLRCLWGLPATIQGEKKENAGLYVLLKGALKTLIDASKFAVCEYWQKPSSARALGLRRSN